MGVCGLATKRGRIGLLIDRQAGMGSNTGKRSGGARGGSADTISACDNVDITALIATRDAVAIALLEVGDILKVLLDTATGRDIVVVYHGDALLGGLTVNGLDKLIECLRKGFPFYGYVLETVGGYCKIRILSGEAPK